ncbi:hypothetical protein EXN66_Car009413 [Channa argus]|uniref:Uncharacterized protein n=1 Tax=Channa argus TaxID=215402 RepID=A0A6G1PU23_CHAAH|nr:hypothetical protein EXN66_Car009413 [Channa argus]
MSIVLSSKTKQFNQKLQGGTHTPSLSLKTHTHTRAHLHPEHSTVMSDTKYNCKMQQF